MQKQAVVSENTPSVLSGKAHTHDVDGESVCVDERLDERASTKALSKKASLFNTNNNEVGSAR